MAAMKGVEAAGDQWVHIKKFLSRSGPLAAPGFDPSDPIQDFLQSCRVLVVGAGGLGCEILKDLALSGFGTIDVIDMDTIDVSNLNRQFLFRQKDVGSFKAEVAARFINERVPSCTVTPHNCRIEDKDESFYRQFNLVVCGLDSVVARRWINGMLLSLLAYEGGELDRTTLIPLIDGGTEGFKGNARVILPGMTACVECTLDLYPPQVNFPMCTIAHKPRLPEHCIEYAKVILWPLEREDLALDGDNPDHIKWLFDKATERAAEFNIPGVTYRLTQGVVKRIIPAVASTNAAIAAVCANEAFKLATSVCPNINNYTVFNDAEGVYAHTFEYEKKDDCLACGSIPIAVQCKRSFTLTELMDQLTTRQDMQLKAPGLTTIMSNGKNQTLYLRNPPAIEAATKKNLALSLSELGIENKQFIMVTDPTSPKALQVQIVFTD